MKTVSQIWKENQAWVDATFAKLDKKLRLMSARSGKKIVDGIDENGRHKEIKPIEWTSGFWGGLNAMMYEHTKEQVYLDCAKYSEEKLDEALFGDYEALYHDVGFMWDILSGVLYRITGDKQSRNRLLWAAAVLASRINIDGKFMHAWNGNHVQNLTIIDTMMNLPTLFRASKELGNDRFARLAMMQADMAMQQHVRADGSVYHQIEHDRETGRALTFEELPIGRASEGSVLPEYGGQGYSFESSWSRGQGWAVYGFTLAYMHCGEQRYLDTAIKVADYVIENVKNDWLPKIDFRAPAEPVYYDSTAGMIYACAFVELAKLLGEEKGAKYMEAAINLLRAAEAAFADWNDETDQIMSHGSVLYPLNEWRKKTVHISIIYGDYYFAEALIKLRGSDFLTW